MPPDKRALREPQIQTAAPELPVSYMDYDTGYPDEEAYKEGTMNPDGAYKSCRSHQAHGLYAVPFHAQERSDTGNSSW